MPEVKIKFFGNTVIFGKIELLTGMHIGGSSDNVEIGGIDSPVIRDPETSYPFIPGSSLKGKLRMITELSNGKIGSNSNKGYVCDCGEMDCKVCRLFGTAADPGKSQILGPTRLIVRDSFPDNKTIEMWSNLNDDYLFTEAKTENSINRLTSEANPRTIERVVRGSCFDFYITVTKYKINDREDPHEEDVKEILKAMRILEDSGIGGNISRGYGRVRFHLCEPIFVSAEDYYNSTEKYKKTRIDLISSESASLKKLEELEIVKSK
ncbi:MAG TPA: type III-A CRISPR-associated RAMP protein Csm3 [Spirochaetota bacterium]|nr:type III-A CRISPR-associated RAMP protein Csm3 [Spirochaetota bacterium]HOK91914.1 type III-A CRISPR-associated RAMP protein Csm3 [Spirochaetota bacterium]